MTRAVEDPTFTIIVPTYGRGALVRATIESALAQTLRAFELLIVSDGPKADGLDAVAALDARIRLIELPENSGSQSAPNNAGLAQARAPYVAYLGHDDIWAPDHLAALLTTFESGGCDAAVSGLAYHSPPGLDFVMVTGLFTDTSAAASHFFPPSSLAHRLRLIDKAGLWRQPETLIAPVDEDFQTRLLAAGARFASTGRLTVHKFAAGHRYLAYLEPEDREQQAMLAAIRSGTMDKTAAQKLVERAEAAGTLMIHGHFDQKGQPPGGVYRSNRSNRGLDRPATRPLTGKTYMPERADSRALDWYWPHQRGDDVLRWSGPSLKPKVLIPFTGDMEAEIRLHVLNEDPAGVLKELALAFNGAPIRHDLRFRRAGRVDLSFVARLRPHAPSVLEISMPRGWKPQGTPETGVIWHHGILANGFTIRPRRAWPWRLLPI
jgi:hypothetical protein